MAGSADIPDGRTQKAEYHILDAVKAMFAAEAQRHMGRELTKDELATFDQIAANIVASVRSTVEMHASRAAEDLRKS